jgi:hypothetical protein
MRVSCLTKRCTVTANYVHNLFDFELLRLLDIELGLIEGVTGRQEMFTLLTHLISPLAVYPILLFIFPIMRLGTVIEVILITFINTECRL